MKSKEQLDVIDLPDERRFVTLAVAQHMIPMPTIGALYQFLWRYKHEFKPVYRLTREAHTKAHYVRMLSKVDIMRIQDILNLSTRGRQSETNISHSRTSFTTRTENHPLAHILSRFA